MIKQICFLCLSLLLFSVAAWAQPFAAIIYNLETTLTTTCGGDVCIPDGTPIQIFWDNDNNGPDADDPPPPICGVTPPDSANDCDRSTLVMNGDELLGLCGMFYSEDTFNSCIQLPNPPVYFLRVCFGGIHWQCASFTLASGIQEVNTTGWVCIDQPCAGCPAPQAPTAMSATDNLCSLIDVNWSYSDTVQSVDSFLVYRDGILIGSTAYAGGTDFTFSDSTAASGQTYLYGVEARRVCTDPADSSVSSRISDGGTRPPQPPIPTAVTASDNFCDSVVVSFSYGTNLGVDSFLVKRNGVRVAAIVAQGVPGARSVRHTGAPAGVAAYTVVGKNVLCGEGTPSAADNGSNLDLLAPANFSASDDQPSTVILNWSDITGETGYSIWRANQDGSGPAQIGTVAANIITFTDINCTQGVVRQYWVYGTGGACGNGDASVHDNGSCGSGPPPVPTVQATDNLCDNIVVTWNNVVNETGYNVYRDAVLLGSTAADVTIFTDNTAASGATYSYTVSAFNVDGESDQSTPDNGTRLGIPPVVPNVVATDTSCFNVLITWTNVNGEAGYVVTRNGNQIGAVGADAVSFTDNAATPGTVYTYGVAAFNACGQGEAGQDQGTRTAGAPATPTGLTASDNTCNVVNVVWNDVATETSYGIVRSNNDGSNPETIGTNAANDTTFDDNTATFGVTFRYWVVGHNECGSSEVSAFDAGSRITTPPQVVGVLVTNATRCDSVVVTWTDVAGETQYSVLRNSTVIGTVAANVVRFADATAVPGTVYSYQVQAVNTCGNGTISDGVQGSLHAPAGPVTNVVASDDNCLQVLITWNAQAGIDSFVVFRSAVRLAAVSGGTTSYADVTAAVGVTYAYTVVAYNLCGAGPASTPDNGTRTSGALPPVGTVTATNDLCATVVVDWSNIAEEDSFQIRRDGLRIGGTAANVLTFTDGTAQVGVTYSYTIVAYNVCGEGASSAPASGGLAPRPAAPASVTILAGCPTLEVNWSLSSGALTYIVTRDGATIATVNHPTDSYVDDPGDNAPHAYQVTASNACGAGLPSASVNGQRQGNTPPPTNLAIDQSNCGLVILTWDPTPDTEGSIIYRNGAALDTVAADVSWYFDSPPGGDNVYWVSAYTAECGESVPSVNVTITVDQPAIFGQSFATANLPAGWTVQHLGSTTDPWHIQNFGDGNFAPQTSLQGTAVAALEYLVSPILDLTGASDLTISFVSKMRDNPGAFGYLQASLDSGNTWPFDLLTLIGNDTIIASRHLSVVFNGATGARFRWKFTGSCSQPAAWSIDDIRICGTVTDAPAPSTITGFEVADNSNGSVTLSWDAARSIFFAGYDLAYGMNGDLSDATLLSSNDYLELAEIGCGLFAVNGLEPNLPYFFAVRMRDQFGNASDFSEIVSASAMPEQSGPLLENPHADEHGSWWNTEQVVIPVRVIDASAVDLSTLEIRADLDGNGSYEEAEGWQPAVILGQDPEGVMSIAATFPTEGAGLRYELRATDEWGNIGYSGDEQTAGIADDWSVNVDLTAPEPVENFAPSSWTTTEMIQLVWLPSNDISASHYEIYLGTHPDITELDALWDAKQDPALANRDTYYTTIEGLAPATVYYFRMRTIDAAGHVGEWSEEISVATVGEIAASAIDDLTIHTVMVGEHKDQVAVQLRWSPVSTDVNGNAIPVSGYRIYANSDVEYAPAVELLIGESTSSEFVIENLATLSGSTFFTVTAVVGQSDGSEGSTPVQIDGSIRR
ncbi:hypothetical protein HZB60_12775 [candidate division KSB1 bacterium]|nr:hypothetical protein [candidate division KSB1 bacterium]